MARAGGVGGTKAFDSARRWSGNSYPRLSVDVATQAFGSVLILVFSVREVIFVYADRRADMAANIATGRIRRQLPAPVPAADIGIDMVVDHAPVRATASSSAPAKSCERVTVRAATPAARAQRQVQVCRFGFGRD